MLMPWADLLLSTKPALASGGLCRWGREGHRGDSIGLVRGRQVVVARQGDEPRGREMTRALFPLEELSGRWPGGS